MYRMEAAVRKISFFLIVIIVCGINISAQQTGKISGVIKDADTGEPLVGVNVIIQSMNIGAATDFEGFYAILNVHPGMYNVTVSMIGYKKTNINEVRVTSGKTTNIDLELQLETTSLGEEVVITAERDVIKKDITSSELAVTAEEIKKLPVENLNDVVKQKAGVVTDATGGIHIRGGRATEVGYMIDGISVKDNYSGNRSAKLMCSLCRK